MKKILLLTDLSEASSHALAFTDSLFSNAVCNIHLLCVYPPDALGGPIYGADPTRSAYSEQLNDLVMGLRREATTDWHTYRASDCPGQWLEIVEKSLALEEYELVVVGARKDGIAELFGQQATALTRLIKANVLVVPVDAPVTKARGVVLAADFANLKNSKLLSPVKELVSIEGIMLTLLTVDTPTKEAIPVEQEIHIRQFLAPIEPVIARLAAPEVRQGIDTYMAGHPIDLLVIIPRHKEWNSLNPAAPNRGYTPAIPLIMLYDDDSNDLPELTEALSNAGQQA